MNVKAVTEILESLGWTVYTDEVGDKYAHFTLPDRTVQVVYGVRNFKDSQQLEVMRSLSTGDFSKACLDICGDDQNYTPLIRSFKGLRIHKPEILEEHVRQASEESIAWAKDQDLDAGLHAYASLPTDAPGARPVWHLAALVMLGDVAKLRHYQVCFEEGNRLGFVNYVTKEYIDRAVSLAENQSRNQRGQHRN